MKVAKIFILLFLILTGCKTLVLDQNNYDFEKRNQELALYWATKENIPIGGCTVVDIMSPKYGHLISNRFCKRGKNRWINESDKSDNNLYAYNKNGVLYIIGSKPDNAGKDVIYQRHFLNCDKEDLNQEELVECDFRKTR